MGRPKGKSHEPNTGSGSSSYPSSSHSPAPAGSGMPSASSSAFTSTIVDKNHSDLHKELFTFIRDIQDERSRGEHNLMNISKTHERLQQEVKITPYYRNKLKGLYVTAKQDAETEAEMLRKALDKITEMKRLQESKKHDDKQPKPIMRRGVLMSLLQQKANTLPLWVSKPGEMPPPLCGAIPADPNYICHVGQKIAARVKSLGEADENWILASVVSFNPLTNKFEVDDIDAEDGKERYTISRRRVVPLPVYRANPETDPDAIFTMGTLVLALYPQTTCFYKGWIDEPPKTHDDDYLVLFEDTSYPAGFSPPLMVAQRYVISCREERKK